MPRYTKKEEQDNLNFVNRARVRELAKSVGIRALSLETVRKAVKGEIEAEGARDMTMYDYLMEQLNLKFEDIVNAAVGHAKVKGRKTVMCDDVTAVLSMPSSKGRFFSGCEPI